MRAETAKKIDALHAQIAELIEAEKQHHDKTHPNSSKLCRHIEHTKLGLYSLPPKDRGLMYEATASLPAAPQEKP